MLSLSLTRDSVVRSTDSLNMTIAVDWDVKPQTKQTHAQPHTMKKTSSKFQKEQLKAAKSVTFRNNVSNFQEHSKKTKNRVYILPAS